MDPGSYLEMVRAEIPAYDELEDELAASTSSIQARSILDLGCGNGETARRVLVRHPGATVVGVDSSPEMVRNARALVPGATFGISRLEDPLPAGPFDLVVSAFAVHHLPPDDKRGLFARIAGVLATGGRFALLDVVVPRSSVDRPVPLEAGVDVPSPVVDQLAWLSEAGLVPRVVIERGDLALLVADHR
jgi:tRNA (cmo5U34)-methyltransferase